MNLKASLFIALAVGLFSQGLVHAQILGPYPTGVATPQIEDDANGVLYSTGTYGNSGTLPSALTGASGGTWMFWYPKRAAFRAGAVSGTDWQDANVGNYSGAFGLDTTASATYSFATGQLTMATGNNSFASGYNTTASNRNTVAFGYSTVSSGYYAAAFGIYNMSEGNASMALGRSTYANGDDSVSIGTNCHADSQCALVVGRYNVGGGTGTAWVATDSIFEVGNGTSGTAQSDALVVLKNGNVTTQGYIRSSPGGDLSMGNFTAAPSGKGNPATLQP